jgi:hypothetical protein
LGGSRDDYRRMLTEVSALTQTLRELAWPSAKPPNARNGGAAKRIRRLHGGGLRPAGRGSG